MRVVPFIFAFSLLPLLGCPKDPEDPITRCFVGDPAAAPEIEIVHQTKTGALVTVVANSRVPLILPPQGGKVILIGVRAKNMDGCPLTLRTAIRDACTNATIATESRPVTMIQNGEWLEPLQPVELSNFSNLPACPRSILTRNVNDEPYKLIVIVEDKDKRRVEKELMVVPTCSEPEFEEQCRCECSTQYTLGDTCDLTLDAGAGCSTPDAGI